MINPLTIVLDAIGFIAVVAGSAAIFFSNISIQNRTAATELIANLQKLRDSDKEELNKQLSELKNQLNDMEDRRKEDLQSIAHLQGQLDTYKDLPLREWADTMKVIATTNSNTEMQLNIIASSNKDILTVLQGSALLAAKDRNTLLNQSQTIQEQTVEHQVVKDRN